MTFDPDRVTTVTFDSYSTLVDVETAEKALADRVARPEPVSRLWRARSLEYTFVANQIDAYQPFYEMNRDALQYALDVYGADITTEERDEILAVYHELDVFDDVFDVVGGRVVGARHLKLRVTHCHGSDPVDAIAFRAVDAGWDCDRLPTRVRLVYRVQINRWRGSESLQLVVEYILPE